MICNFRELDRLKILKHFAFMGLGKLEGRRLEIKGQTLKLSYPFEFFDFMLKIKFNLNKKNNHSCVNELIV